MYKVRFDVFSSPASLISQQSIQHGSTLTLVHLSRDIVKIFEGEVYWPDWTSSLKMSVTEKIIIITAFTIYLDILMVPFVPPLNLAQIMNIKGRGKSSLPFRWSNVLYQMH